MEDHKLTGSLYGNGRCYWDVISTGDWAEDCRVGEEYARIWFEASTSMPPLAWILRDMVAAGRWTGVEVGFIQAALAQKAC